MRLELVMELTRQEKKDERSIYTCKRRRKRQRKDVCAVGEKEREGGKERKSGSESEKENEKDEGMKVQG